MKRPVIIAIGNRMSPRYTLIQVRADNRLIFIEEGDIDITHAVINRDLATILEDGIREHEVGLFEEEDSYTVATLSDSVVEPYIIKHFDDDREWDDDLDR